MKRNKVFALFLLLVFLLPFVATAEGSDLFDCVMGDRTKDAWFAEDVAGFAGKGSEWYIFAMKMAGCDIDGEQYLASLDAYLADNDPGIVGRQRCALASVAMGRADAETVDATAGKGGMMSYVFALHLLNNGAVSSQHTAESIIDTIISMQNEDGGWSLSGTASDVDVTAMTLQALAPHRQAHEQEISRALDRLASVRTENGGYKSYGTENCESTAMVIIALCALDKADDERFSGLDSVLESYAVDGGYSHAAGGSKNNVATVQTLCAKAAVIYAAEGNIPFVFTSDIDGEASEVSDDDTSDISDEISKAVSSDDVSVSVSDDTSSTESIQTDGTDVKLWLCMAIAPVALVFIIIFVCKKQYKKLAIAAVIAAVLVCTVLFLNIETPEQHFSAESKQYEHHVTFAVYCDAIEAEPKPYGGVLIAECEIGFDEGESVCDILKRAAKQHGLTVDGTTYIRSIGTLSEMQYGAMSGWLYSVNGEHPDIPCNEYFPGDNNIIVWSYTTGEQ